MKARYYIPTAVLALMTLGSCNNDAINEVIDIPENGYIFLNTEVDSRGVLIEDKLEDAFGVLGYYYASDWNTAKVQATPNVFSTYNQQVTWDGTKHSYTPLQEWLPKQKYSFFAYYPYSSTAVSAANHEGTPYMDYTLASRSDVSALVDVMTSQVIDTDINARTVNFNMKHRLSAIDVVARNFNGQYDPDTNVKGDEKDVYVKITDMSITFSNLLFDNVRIPLHEDSTLVYSATATTQKATYTLLSSANDMIAPAVGNESELASITSSERGTTMIVIPQNGSSDLITTNDAGETVITDITEADSHLNCTISMTYDYVDANGNTLNLVTDEMPVSRDFTVDKGLESGRRYYIQLTFTRGAITIAFIESEEWSDETINHEFE